MGRWHARALSHCLPDLTLPIFRIGRKTAEWRERKEENGERKTRVDLQAGSCREKAGSLSHATTTTGLQKQTSHLLRWLLPRPTPRCHYVCLCGPSIRGHVHVHVHVHVHFGKLCVAAGHSNGKENISGGSHLADTGDKARPYLPLLAKGVAHNDKKFYVPDQLG